LGGLALLAAVMTVCVRRVPALAQRTPVRTTPA
jgi:hypothetical protein